MLRIHFTGEDLARTRVAAHPEVGVELLFSLLTLIDRGRAPGLSHWRRGLRGRLDRNASLLFDLCGDAYLPDFLVPLTPGGDPQETIDAIRSTSRTQLRADIAGLASHRTLSPAVRRLAEGDPEMVHVLGDAAAAYHRVGIAPHWAHVRRLVDADRARRGRILLDGGVEALLSTLHPTIRWRPPVLYVGLCTPNDFDVDLCGRGLVLQPSVFAATGSGVIYPPDGQPVLGYPVGGASLGPAAPPDRRLAALLGRTRAAVLDLVATTAACTTTEIARRLDISPASASTHAAVLRDAGLIATERHGSAVLHMVTSRGVALLGP
jgi:hypothetical protein